MLSFSERLTHVIVHGIFFLIVPRELDDSMRKQNSMQTKTFMAYRRNLSYRDLRDRDMNP
jgi:hypothetical protein